VNEPDLHVFEAGEGDAIVLLHGLPSPPADLEALAPHLPGRRVLVPHLPGYGATPHAPGSQGVEAIEAALIEALALRHVKNPVLVGHSMGGYRALSLALAMGARAVVCLGGFAELSPEEQGRFKGFADALRGGPTCARCCRPASCRRRTAPRGPPTIARSRRGWISPPPTS